MKVCIFGGGLSAVSLAYFLQSRKDIERIEIFEKEATLGGLARSFDVHGVMCDIGPHVIFSKDKPILDLMNSLLEPEIRTIRRSNRIIHEGRRIQFPFENDLSALPEPDTAYCLNGFIKNPYEEYDVSNMLQFFLKTFGEGITNLYLRPYNEKIWKHDPAFIDLQMVERIPKPPKEDIVKSAEGQTVDGYLHQLYHTYPNKGGINTLVDAFVNRLEEKVHIHLSSEVRGFSRSRDGYLVELDDGPVETDRVVSTLPLNVLPEMYNSRIDSVLRAAGELKHNSLGVIIINVRQDAAGDNFAFMIADKRVNFHRLTKIDYLGAPYSLPGTVTYMAEVTYRDGDINSLAPDEVLIESAVNGLKMIGFIQSNDDVNFTWIKRFDYSYVIYDLKHRANTKQLADYFAAEGVYLNGRFGTFKYLNMDAVIRQSMELASSIK